MFDTLENNIVEFKIPPGLLTQVVGMGVQWYFCLKSIITCLYRILNSCLWSSQLPLQGANSQHTSFLTFLTYSCQDKSLRNQDHLTFTTECRQMKIYNLYQQSCSNTSFFPPSQINSALRSAEFISVPSPSHWSHLNWLSDPSRRLFPAPLSYLILRFCWVFLKFPLSI